MRALPVWAWSPAVAWWLPRPPCAASSVRMAVALLTRKVCKVSVSPAEGPDCSTGSPASLCVCGPARASPGHPHCVFHASGVCLSDPSTSLLAVGFSIPSGTTQVPLLPQPPGVRPPDVGRAYTSIVLPPATSPLESVTVSVLWQLWAQTWQPEPGKENVLPTVGPCCPHVPPRPASLRRPDYPL